MKIIPAIDLYDGKCVRLLQGKFESRTEYYANPLQCAFVFIEQGATEIHIVDLSGAKIGMPVQLNIILEIKNNTSLTIQTGGGFRRQEAIINALENNIDRVVVGSLAVTNPELMKQLINEYGVDRFVLAFDIFIKDKPIVAIKGWREKTMISLWDMLEEYSEFKNLRILCTDINRDGMLNGPNIDLYSECIKKYSHFNFQASGGISQLQDLYQLKKIGVSSVIIGKALYENCFTFTEAQTEAVTC